MAEIGVRPPQAKECHQPPEVERGKTGHTPPRAFGGSTTLPTPWCLSSDTNFGFLASRRVKEQISVVLSHQVYANLLWPLSDTNRLVLCQLSWRVLRVMKSKECTTETNVLGSCEQAISKRRKYNSSHSWRCRGLNPGPRTCEARALPLSYTPSLSHCLWGFFWKYLTTFCGPLPIWCLLF